MNVVRHRPSARFDVIRPAGFRILAALDRAAQACHTDLLVTSGTDSHAMPDPHCTGEAYDVSVHGLSAQQIADVYASLKGLGPLFTVLYEVKAVPSDPTLRPIAYVNVDATGPHLHVQRKKGTVFPPEWSPEQSNPRRVIDAGEDRV